MTRAKIEREYFDWMYDLVTRDRFNKSISFRRLLLYLHEIEFTYIITKDANIAEDGIDLRYRYAYEQNEDVESYLLGPCSVLEMMIALVLRCEETIMDDPELGDRTGQWFWEMVANLGLAGMTDDIFDEDEVEDKIAIFLNREYAPDGRGGLFYIRDCERDLRRVEIWHQMLWRLDYIA